MKKLKYSVLITITLVAQSFSAHSQDTPYTLITNAQIFDGVKEKLIDVDELIENNLIKRNSERPGKQTSCLVTVVGYAGKVQNGL